jgi:hypothetical protein
MRASHSPLLLNFFSHALRTPSNTLIRTDLGFFGKKNLEAGGEGGRLERGGRSEPFAALTPLEIFAAYLTLLCILVKTLASNPMLLLVKSDRLFLVNLLDC